MATNLTLGTLFTADVRQFLQGINQIKTAVSGLQATFRQAGQGASAMGTGMAAALNKTTTAIKQQNAAIKQSQQQLTGLAGMWQRVQQAMKTSLAYGTAGAAIYGIIDGLKQGVTAIADYDQALKNLQAISQATDAEMVGMADTIKEVSSKYIYSTKEISDGMVLMAQAGFSATETMQAMESAAKLAMGTLEDMKLTVDLLTTTVVAFNMKAVESERIADIMANAMNRSKLTLDKLRVSFNYVGNAAYEAGISLEETAAAMSVMSNAGMRASTIGTAFRQVIANLIAPNRRVREEMQGLGIELSQLDPKVAGFSTVVQNLSKILVNQKTGLVDMSKAYSLFGLRAAQAAAILARSASDEYPRMLAMMYEVGSASAMADKQMEGLVSRFKNIAANAQLIAIAIGEGGLIKVFRMLADALLFVTKALRDFFQSDVGKITSSFIAWSAATAVVTLALKGLTAFILTGLIPALAALGRDLKNAIFLMSAMQGLSLTDKINTLLNVLTRGNPIFLAYAAGIGAIIAAYQYWKGAEERQIETLTRSSNAYRTASDTLRAYIDIFEKLRVKQAKGQDISIEYEAAVKRLLKTYPQLSGAISANTEALESNIEKMRDYDRASIEKDIEKQIELLRIYDQQLSEVGESFGDFAVDSKNSLGQIAPEFAAIRESTDQMEQDLQNLSGTMGSSAKSADEVAQSLDTVVSAENRVGKEAEKTNAIMKNRDQSLVAIAKGWEKLGDSIDTIVRKLRELGAEEAQIKVVMSALKKWGDDVAKEAGEIEAAMQNLPHVFTNFFDTLDAGAKVAFAKAAKSMESEVAQYQKTAQAILKTEEDRYAAEAFIRTKHLLKFADDVLKEKVTGEQLLKFKQNLLEEEKRLIRERLDTQLKAARGILEDELRVAKDNADKRKAAEEKYQKAVQEIRKKNVQALVAIEQAGNNEVVESYKKTADEVVKTGQKMANDYLTELDRMVDAAKKKIEQLTKARAENEESLIDKIRGLKQKGKSDSEKFADDESRVNELLGKARDATYRKSYDEAKKYYDRAADISGSLAREVKDNQDNIIRSEADTTATAISYLERIKAESDELYRKQIEEEKKKMEEAKTFITEINDLMKAYGGEWDKLSQQKLKAFIEGLDTIAKKTDAILDSTSKIGKDWANAVNKLNKSPQPQEPSMGSQSGLGAVQRKEGAGTITVGGRTYDVDEYGGAENTISYGGKTYGVGGETGGSISVGGKTFDVNELADYGRKVEALSEKIQANVKNIQLEVVQDAEESGRQAVETIGTVGTQVTTAISDATDTATASVSEAMQSAQTAEASITGMSNQVKTIADSAMAVNNEFVKLGFNVEMAKNAFTGLQELVTAIAQNPIKELISQAALTILENVKKTLSEIKEMYDSLQSKTITLVINTIQTGGGGAESSDSGWGGSSNEAAYNEAKADFGGGYSEGLRHGGMVSSLNNIFENIKRFAGGGKLPGYGGGDKQIIAAESGEFVINKESTAKFRPLIEAINSDSVADFGKRFGGVIKSAMKPFNVPAYAGGGMVSGGGSTGPRIGKLKIEIKPRYMSGDRTTARKFAMDIKQELDDLEKRRGRR